MAAPRAELPLWLACKAQLPEPGELFPRRLLCGAILARRHGRVDLLLFADFEVSCGASAPLGWSVFHPG